MRAVRGVWDSGATIIHWVVKLEGGVTRRGRRCVGVVFAFPVSVCVKIVSSIWHYYQNCCCYFFSSFQMLYKVKVYVTSLELTCCFFAESKHTTQSIQ